MADEILQSMGFDASDALRTLDLLDKNFATFQNRLNSVAQSMRGFNANAGKTTAALIQIRNNATSTVDALSRLSAQPITLGGRVDGQDLLRGADAAAKMNELLGQTTNQAGQAANAINNVGSQSTKSLNSARRSVNSFAISWETLTRIVTTQILVRELSDSFNFELLDAANAKFEIMQNGFEQTAEQAEVFSASAAFAKTAVADLATSVDVITGTLNAMGEGADQAEIVAAKLFRTVDQGKVVGTELARVLGRITPAAQELGITLDEELAALSTITIAGVGASEAITQIRGTMIALQKPSEALSAAIRELGFETSEQLIAARGYVGALRAVIGTTDGTQTAIARLFPRVRGLNAAIRLTGEGFDVFNEHLERTQNTSLAEFGDIFETRIDTQSERVQKSLQQLSNFFTVELGGSLVGATDKALQFVGGVDSVIDGMRALVPVVTTGAVVVGSFGVAMGTVTTASRLAAFNLQKQVPTVLNLTNALFGVQNGAKAAAIGLSALQGAATGLFIGVATVEFLKFTRERIDSELDAAVEAYTKGRLEIVKRNASTRAEITAQEEKASSDVIRLLEDQIASKRRIYNQDVDNARDANQLLLTDYRSVLDRITGVFEDHAQTQERRAKQLADAVSNSQQRQVDAVTELADRRF
ncbi:Phage tail tape measure protein, partial [Durusdinium trenchii]